MVEAGSGGSSHGDIKSRQCPIHMPGPHNGLPNPSYSLKKTKKKTPSLTTTGA